MGPVLSGIQHWKARGKTIIADFDDAYQLLQPSNPSYEYWINGRIPTNGDTSKMITLDPPPLTQFKWGLRLCHAATVPSRKLANDFRKYTDIHYLPNYIELDKYSKVTHEQQDGITIGWGGSLSHLESFTQSGVLKALQRVCKARKHVKVMICGADQRIFNELPIPEGQKVLHPWVSYNQWSNVLSNFDIGLAPLNGPYDERRSWIKVLEYLVMRIPWAASDNFAYRELSPFGHMVQNNTKAWENAIFDLVDNLEEHKQLAAGEAYLFGISQSVDDNVEKIVQLYSEIAAEPLVV
jgi:glycosyltransferase involved in cell wall biosynthesis